MQEVLNELIHPDQTGFLKGRYIGENLLELVSIIEWCEKDRVSALIVSFDFEKAFDKVEWNVLNKVLE